MEAEKTLTNEEIIRELLDLLKKNTMKEVTKNYIAVVYLNFMLTCDIM